MPQVNALNRLVDYASRVNKMATPASVLDELHDITANTIPLNVLGAGRLPQKFGDWSEVRDGRNVFVHKNVPVGWWKEYTTIGPKVGYDGGMMMSRFKLAPYTWTESTRHLDPTGGERWPYDLALKYGMRDGLTCPIAGRWVVAFWSNNVLTDLFPEHDRALVFMAASFAAIRLEQFVTPDGAGDCVRLTARELSVLRLASLGRHTKDIADTLDLGMETVRSHFKKAQRKLGVHDRTHAVAEAIRQTLIP